MSSSQLRPIAPGLGIFRFIPGERLASYKAACLLVWEIGGRLDRGEHLRIGGKFCRTLDEAVTALESVEVDR
jgi:hypothetical protein